MVRPGRASMMVPGRFPGLLGVDEAGGWSRTTRGTSESRGRPLLGGMSIYSSLVGGRLEDVPSAPRNSRTPLRKTANPSADRENGVRPAPLSWISCRPPSGVLVSTTESAVSGCRREDVGKRTCRCSSLGRRLVDLPRRRIGVLRGKVSRVRHLLGPTYQHISTTRGHTLFLPPLP